MFEPEHKSKIYLFIFITTAFLLGWGIYTQYKPMIIQASCSEIAASTSTLVRKENKFFDPSSSYDNIKNKCILEAGLNR